MGFGSKEVLRFLLSMFPNTRIPCHFDTLSAITTMFVCTLLWPLPPPAPRLPQAGWWWWHTCKHLHNTPSNIYSSSPEEHGALRRRGGVATVSLGNSIAVAYLISIELPLSAAHTPHTPHTHSHSHTHTHTHTHTCGAMQRLFDSWFDYIFKVIDIWHTA